MQTEYSARVKHFCCAYHEAYYSTDFDSDIEELPYAPKKLITNKVAFMEKYPANALALAKHMNLTQEIGTQCTFDATATLLQLASTPVYSTDSQSRCLTPRYRDLNPTHIPVLTIPAVESSHLGGFPDLPSVFQCRFCGIVFGSGQALGGHTSRKHPRHPPK